MLDLLVYAIVVVTALLVGAAIVNGTRRW